MNTRMGIFGWSLPPGCGTLPGEETRAWETQLDGVWYAWDEDDRIYRQDPDHPDAGEDGYVYIGNLAWPEDDEPVPALRQALEKQWVGLEKNHG